MGNINPAIPTLPALDSEVFTRLRSGTVIPAHPLALDSNRKLDERRQSALSRYYCESGAGGLAVGVHTTQFAIRDPKHGLYRPVLQLAIEVMKDHERKIGTRMIRVAGICGLTEQALEESRIARDLGYDLGLLSLGSLQNRSEEELIEHCRCVAAAIPLFGFYLQPAVGGRILDYSFWRRFLEIEQVCAIKVAPFNRYHTLDVVRALADSGRSREIALYTGNDDSIVADLLEDYRLSTPSGDITIRFAGGLLGHWAVWTKRAAELLQRILECRADNGIGAFEILGLAGMVTDANAAFFDTRNDYSGCIAGIHEVLRRQGLLAGRWCLNPKEELSPGQAEEIDRVIRCYPQLNDDEFVAENLDRWLA
jgi:dihydrodipicolinate synthase/N-acetylneuraminate lyase